MQGPPGVWDLRAQLAKLWGEAAQGLGAMPVSACPGVGCGVKYDCSVAINLNVVCSGLFLIKLFWNGNIIPMPASSLYFENIIYLASRVTAGGNLPYNESYPKSHVTLIQMNLT